MKNSDKFVFVLVRDAENTQGDELAAFSFDNFCLQKLIHFFKEVCVLPEYIKPDEIDIEELFNKKSVDMGWGYYFLVKLKVL